CTSRWACSRSAAGSRAVSDVPAVLRIANVSKSFYGLRAVHNVSLDAPAGRVTAVIGPNGTGKTTLFHCVSGLLRADRCDSRLDLDGAGAELRLAGRTPEEMCRLGIARTFQQVRLFDSLSVVDNVMLATLVRRPLGFAGALSDRLVGRCRQHRARRDAAHALLARVGLRSDESELAA